MWGGVCFKGLATPHPKVAGHSVPKFLLPPTCAHTVNFTGLTTPPVLAKVFVTRTLMRDLFDVANLLRLGFVTKHRGIDHIYFVTSPGQMIFVILEL